MTRNILISIGGVAIVAALVLFFFTDTYTREEVRGNEVSINNLVPVERCTCIGSVAEMESFPVQYSCNGFEFCSAADLPRVSEPSDPDDTEPGDKTPGSDTEPDDDTRPDRNYSGELSVTESSHTATASGEITRTVSGDDVDGTVQLGTIDWGDGTSEEVWGLGGRSAAQSFELSHTYSASGTYTVILNDPDGNELVKETIESSGGDEWHGE